MNSQSEPAEFPGSEDLVASGALGRNTPSRELQPAEIAHLQQLIQEGLD